MAFRMSISIRLAVAQDTTDTDPLRGGSDAPAVLVGMLREHLRYGPWKA